MHTIRLFLLSTVMVCLGSTMVPDGRAVAGGTASDHTGTPMPRAGNVVSGVSVTLEETASHAQSQLRIDICGHEATRLPHGFPLAFEVSAPVQSVVVRNVEAGIVVHASADGRRATVILTRDPFIPPEPWRVVVLLRIDGALGEGHLLIGSANYPLPTPLSVGHSTAVLGQGCDEHYAVEPVPGRVWVHGRYL